MGSRYLNDLRRSERVVFRTSARLLAAGPVPIAARVLDMSERGIAILTHTEILSSTECMVAVTQPGIPIKQEISFLARAVYCCATDRGFRVGLTFVDMDGYSRSCIEDILMQYRGWTPVIASVH